MQPKSPLSFVLKDKWLIIRLYSFILNWEKMFSFCYSETAK